MSTTYYVRTYNCSFSSYANQSISRNLVTYMEGTTLRNYTNVLSSFSPRILGSLRPNYDVYGLGDNGGNSYSLGDNIRLELEYANWDVNFTPATLSTFKTEICTYFNSHKTETEYGLNWGVDNNEINFLLFKVTYDNDPGKIYYATAFYMGNDPQADETIVI